VNASNTSPYSAKLVDIVDLENATTYVRVNNNASVTSNISIKYILYSNILENPLDPEANKSPYPISQLSVNTFTVQGDSNGTNETLTLDDELVFDFESYFLTNLKIKSSQLVSLDKDLFGLNSSGFLL